MQIQAMPTPFIWVSGDTTIPLGQVALTDETGKILKDETGAQILIDP